MYAVGGEQDADRMRTGCGSPFPNKVCIIDALFYEGLVDHSVRSSVHAP